MTESPRLARILCADSAPERPVARRGNDWLTRADFRQRAMAWQAATEQVPASRVGVYFTDAYEFAAALYGLWYAGKTALLMGDRLPATVDLVAGHVGAFIGEFDDRPGLPVISSPTDKPKGTGGTLPALDPEHPAVIVLTSGSTGAPKMVPMALSQLDTEVGMHEQQWGAMAGRSLVIGTVSHQHIYGLVWRVLWPLAGGRPFVSEVCRYAEDALALAEGESSCVLVTTPTHLARWPHQPGGRAPGNWAMVVSSTAPLAHRHSEFGHGYFGVPVTELFGSSETGGIAWRQQTIDDVWTTLEGIDVSRDRDTGALLLKSPLLAEDDWFETGDRADVYSHRRFRLLGRLDRIAKIEGKRVSLSAMENRLSDHEAVREVRALVLTGKRTETAVVAVLEPFARDRLKTERKRVLTRELRNWLSGHFESPVLPRRWRFVEQLPRNAQGKIPQYYLEALFEKTAAASANATTRHPVVLKHWWQTEHQVCVRLRVAPELVFFQGHFDGFPVLPGVVQLNWAEAFARKYFGDRLACRNAFSRMEAVKFQEPIRPGRELSMALTLEPERSRLQFRFHDGETVFSSGRMVFDGVQEPV